MTDQAPYIYQVVDGREFEIAGQFELLDTHTYRFDVTGSYDPSTPLIIDPDLAWSTYLGGTGEDRGFHIAADAAGNAVVAGSTASVDFAGAINVPQIGTGSAFVAKVNAAGNLQWVTYLGGTGFDAAYGIAVDSAGNALVAGSTTSVDFAGAINAPQGGTADAFVAKVNAAGNLQWVTYLGGTDFDAAYAIAVDGADNALVVGSTMSIDFAGAINAPQGGTHDAFVGKLSSTGTLQWATYLGGTAEDQGLDLAVDAAGSALVAGSTASVDFAGAINAPQGGTADAFVAKVNAAGDLQWAAYLGGTAFDAAHGIAVDSAGNARVTGTTFSLDFAGAVNVSKSSEGFSDAFVAKVNSAGGLEWTKYLGGTDSDAGWGIALDAAGNAWITGSTQSVDFDGATNLPHGGATDAFVVKVSATGTLMGAAYLGGTGRDVGSGISVDAAGNAWVTGETDSTDFSGATNVYLGGEANAFVAKIQVPVTYDIAGYVETFGAWWLAVSTGDSFVNEDAGRWSTAVTWVDVMVGDFTGDGFDDIVGRVEETGDWWMAVSDGAGGFTNERWGRWSQNVDWVDVVVGDFTGDGLPDIAGRVEHNGEWWVAVNDGVGGFINQYWGRWSTAVDWVDVMVIDFGYGADSIVGRVAHSGDWWAAWSLGFGFQNIHKGRWSPNVTWVDVMVGNFLDQHRQDIVGRVEESGDWWLADTSGGMLGTFQNEHWGRWSTAVTWVDVMPACFAELEFDDIIGRVEETGEWWLNYTGQEQIRVGRWSPAVEWVDVRAADFTGNGLADVAGRVQHSGDWWVAVNTPEGPNYSVNQHWGRWSPNVTWGPVLTGNFAVSAAALHAAYAPSPNSDLPAPISQSALAPIVEEAVLRLGPELDAVAFEVHLVDLPGLMLGRTVGTTIYLDPSAAGFGWYLNPTDADFEPGGRLGELTARPGTEAVHRIDLLTAVMHELRHLLGHDHAEDGLMLPTLGPGIRRLPIGSDDAVWADRLDEAPLEADRLDAYFAALV